MEGSVLFERFDIRLLPEGGRMSQSDQYVVFALEDQRIALRLSAVDRVFRAVEVTPLPEAPEIARHQNAGANE